MSKKTLILILLCLNSAPAFAFNIGDIFNDITKRLGNKISIYPEVSKQKIFFKTGRSPLAPIETINDNLQREGQKAIQSVDRGRVAATSNKIVGLQEH